MGDYDEDDDKPTVVLDIKALKNQKLKTDEDLSSIAKNLKFQITKDDLPPQVEAVEPAPVVNADYQIVLLDFESDFFEKSLKNFPTGHHYVVAKTLAELNLHLKSKDFQIVILNYDANPKVVNQLCAQIKQKRPSTKTLIIAKNIAPEKAKLHAQTPSGANGYYQLPLDADKIEKEFLKILPRIKKAG